MNEQERNDLLVRLDEKTDNMGTRLTSIEMSLTAMPCCKNTEKINTLERITWTALIAAIGGIINSIWGIK